jgi:DNA ligase-1
MKFLELAKYLQRLEKTSSRIEITKILADLFKKSGSEEIDKIVYLLLGSLAPSYQNIVFNLAERMMLQVIATAYKKDLDKVRRLYKERGDLGIVAESFAKTKSGNLSVSQVYDEMLVVAEDEGVGSQERKIKATANLLAKLDPLGARYVARIPVGKLRLGFSDKTILDALSWMQSGDKSKKAELEKAYHLTPNVGALAKKVRQMGIKKAAEKTEVTVGVPVLPMLAQRLKSPEEMIAKMGRVAIEPKFDGLRVIIHFQRGYPIKAFTRNLNEISHMFPELKKIGRFAKADSAIFDTEAIGLDPKTRKMVHFQRTMQRRRKHDIAKLQSEIPLKFQVFDLLYKNGTSLMAKPYEKRRLVLAKTIRKNNLFVVDEYVLTDKPKVIQQKHRAYLKMGLEGAMIKKADSKYIPGRTGWRWVKMKEVEKAQGKLADTVDCIVMGYTRGKGKRAQFGVGQFLAGIRDGGKIKTVTKVGTGLTDEQFKELYQRLQKLGLAKKPTNYEVHKDLEPDFWVRPKEVVELAADEVTVSPKHSSGYALRFPRLVRFRDDKSSVQATTLAEIKRLFQLQK